MFWKLAGYCTKTSRKIKPLPSPHPRRFYSRGIFWDDIRGIEGVLIRLYCFFQHCPIQLKISIADVEPWKCPLHLCAWFGYGLILKTQATWYIFICFWDQFHNTPCKKPPYIKRPYCGPQYNTLCYSCTTRTQFLL